MLGAGIESLLRTLFVPSAAIGGAGSNSPYSTPEGARDSRIGSGPEVSAVDSRDKEIPSVKQDTADTGKVKALLPIAGALGSAYANNMQEAKAAPWDSPGMSERLKTIDDKPLEDPVYSPIDLMIAPLGATGAKAILEALIVDPAMSIGADYVMDAVK